MNSRGQAKRIGVAFTRERGNRHRRNEYGIYDDGTCVTCVFEGYRFKDKDGTETQVGLPLAGPGAVHLHTQFSANDFEIVRYFK